MPNCVGFKYSFLNFKWTQIYFKLKYVLDNLVEILTKCIVLKLSILLQKQENNQNCLSNFESFEKQNTFVTQNIT